MTVNQACPFLERRSGDLVMQLQGTLAYQPRILHKKTESNLLSQCKRKTHASYPTNAQLKEQTHELQAF
ncbi:MAG: hypothetical protein KME08_07070 [Aphanothece sp. CMT-3BRIN-NPC111]|jgi:hypothetical protein|nr:hypothetical protein [Aphanothece sp. CMT-3BRIN-NPC111]